MTKLLRLLIILLTPFAINFAVITFVIGAWFPNYEYAKASFPEDAYGFTQEERLDLALVAVEYLEASESAEESIYLLEQQTFPDSDEPLYTESEIDHMVDVKVLSDLFRIAGWVMSLGIALGLAWMFVQGRQQFFRTLRGMGGFTLFLLTAIGAYLVIRWETFFVQFHELLFADGTWSFPLSSSLIRLFPDKLWFDCGVIIVGGTFGIGLLLFLIGLFFTKKEKSG